MSFWSSMSLLSIFKGEIYILEILPFKLLLNTKIDYGQLIFKLFSKTIQLKNTTDSNHCTKEVTLIIKIDVLEYIKD